MGRRQGVRRLQSGFDRYLTPHELKRGYVFVSNDKHLSEILDVRAFDVDITGQTFRGRRLDVSGRFHVPRRVLQDIGTLQRLRFSLTSRQGLRVERVHLDA